jgi:hypothetical protein
MPKTKSRQCMCLECGVAYQAQRSTSKFCSGACRLKFNNRRAVRGAQLYDLIMAHRFERERAAQAGVLKLMWRMASMFRKEDEEQRAGRRSWDDLRSVFEQWGWLSAYTVLQAANPKMIAAASKAKGVDNA